MDLKINEGESKVTRILKHNNDAKIRTRKGNLEFEQEEELIYLMALITHKWYENKEIR